MKKLTFHWTTNLSILGSALDTALNWTIVSKNRRVHNKDGQMVMITYKDAFNPN